MAAAELRQLCCLFLTCMCFLQLCLGQDTLEQFIARKEKHVTDIAAVVRDVWSRDCSEFATQCNASRLNCGNDLGPGLSNRSCTLAAYATHFTDDICPCDGTQKFNFDEGYLRLPKFTTFDNPKIMQTVCRLQRLDVVFNSIIKSDPQQLQIYFGAVNGAFRIFPGGPRNFDPPNASRSDLRSIIDNCASYDPRVRPWFRDAVLGPKSVVILLDVSGDMGRNYANLGSPPTNLDVAKALVRALLGTLRVNDFFSVITFAQTTTTLNSTTGPRLFVWDDNINKTVFEALDAVTAVDVNSPGGTVRNYTAGLDAAFTALKLTKSTCDKKMVVVIARGGDTTALDESVLAFIQTLQTPFQPSPAHILTYSLLVTQDSGALLSAIACNNRGVYTNVDVTAQSLRPEVGMPNFLLPYYVLGGSGKDTSVLWTEGYTSATGTQDNESTAVMAVHDASGNLIGVVGVDLSVQQVRDMGGVQRISQESTMTTSACRDVDFPECDLQRLRAYNDYLTGSTVSTCPAGPTNCSLAIPGCTVNLRAENVYARIGDPSATYDSKFCCTGCLGPEANTSSAGGPGSGGGAVGKKKDKAWVTPVAVVGSIAGLVAIAVVGFLIYRSRRMERGSPNAPGSRPAPTDKDGISRFFNSGT